VSPDKFEHPSTRSDALTARVRQIRRTFDVGLFSLAVAVATHTLFPLLRWRLRRRIARGETLWLDDLAGPAPAQTFEGRHGGPADLSPNPGKPRKARHMRLAAYPPPTYPFAYRAPPLSGNVINGRGESTPRRADHVFFGDGYRRAWGKLDWYFQVMEPTRIHRVIVALFWQDRRRVGPVSGRQIVPPEPAEMAAQIKAVARRSGAALVGVTRLTDDVRYADFDVPFTYAISVAVPMDREEMLHTPSDRSGLEIQRVYKDVNRVAIELAEHIRALGWPARASTNISPDATEVLHLPIAVRAGLGQLGKHGSMITPEHGSNLRLATVLTDLPLAIDEPRDFGVDDFCASCRICETNCPPHALSPSKQMVRGVHRWYVDFDKCVPYFAKTAGCGICIEVCPWSEPGQGLSLAERLRRRRMAP